MQISLFCFFLNCVATRKEKESSMNKKAFQVPWKRAGIRTKKNLQNSVTGLMHVIFGCLEIMHQETRTEHITSNPRFVIKLKTLHLAVTYKSFQADSFNPTGCFCLTLFCFLFCLCLYGIILRLGFCFVFTIVEYIIQYTMNLHWEQLN